MKKSLKFYLNMISIFALLFIFLRQFVLNETLEIVSWGSEFGELIFNLSIGYLVTYWFYYLTVYRRELKYRNKSYILVKKRAMRIVLVFNTLKESMYQNDPVHIETGKNMDKKDDYERILKSINPNENCPTLDGSFQHQTWAKSIETRRNIIEKSIEDIFIVSMYLDSEDIELFAELHTSKFLELTQVIDLRALNNLDFLAKPMYEFSEKVDIINDRFKN